MLLHISDLVPPMRNTLRYPSKFNTFSCRTDYLKLISAFPFKEYDFFLGSAQLHVYLCLVFYFLCKRILFKERRGKRTTRLCYFINVPFYNKSCFLLTQLYYKETEDDCDSSYNRITNYFNHQFSVHLFFCYSNFFVFAVTTDVITVNTDIIIAIANIIIVSSSRCCSCFNIYK